MEEDKKEKKGEGDCQCEEGKCQCGKKAKNLISIIILLAGLFVGSLFVDFSQVVKGSGYSQKNLDKSQIFEASGKTWVAYTEPAVPVTIINDDKCTKCDVTEPLVWLKRVLPTVSTIKVAYDSDQGKNLISQYGIKTLPAFIFDASLDKTDFYTQAATVFDKSNGQYVLRTQDLGLPAGKFLSLPTVDQSDATFGQADSNVTVIVFSDFQCPYCKVLYQTVRDTMKQYGDKVLFDYKELPLDIHPQANNAALAASCAQEQNKFWEYGDKLYQNQTAWSATKDTSSFKQYAAQLGLNTTQFNQCLDSKKYQDKIDADKKEATDFQISGTPAVFINDTFETGAISADQLKNDIEAQLNPGSQSSQPSSDSSNLQQNSPAQDNQATPDNNSQPTDNQAPSANDQQQGQ
jgi:protein-disulfide isomerase